ncbi:helix-turn-helix domain-containing protein [Rosettibacter firmus]|uniref:helix-turn-helix domain-containing protein n=1 Tax=Rosettibacter firmus TaxID=3111522 RepID=UPI00336BFD65
MASEALKKFAEELKSLREEKGFTLQQISNHTKIDIKFLQMIEDGNFNFLPEIYVKAFIKEYAQTMDLDVNVIVEKYNSAKKEVDSNVSSYEKEKSYSEKISTSKKKESLIIDDTYDKDYNANEYLSFISDVVVKKKIGPKLKYYIIGGVVLIFLLLIYLIFINSGSSIIEENPYKDITTDRYKPDTSSVTQLFKNSDSLTLLITPVKNVWLKVLCDKKEVYQQMAPANQLLNFKASKEFYVVVGNAGYVKMNLNGKPLSQAGNMGEIRRYYISNDTVKSFLVPIQKNDEKKSSTEN